MRAVFAGIFTVTMCAASAVQASPSYNYVELDYLDIDVDPLSGDGWAIGGSGLVSPHVFLLGRYSDAEVDDKINGINVDLDIEQISLGVGIQTPLQQNENISVFGQLTFEDIEGESSVVSGSADDSGFAVEGGGRFQVAPQFEFNASLRYIDVEEFYDGELGFRVGAEWRALPWLALSLDYDQVESVIDDVEQIQAGVRVYWDQLQLQ